MNHKRLMQMSREGHLEALRIGLDKEENWTPLLVHIHTSRMLVGGVLGTIAGFCLGILASAIYVFVQCIS